MKVNMGLTTFRGLTLISIFLFHSYVFEAGDLAVQGFFVLSGFLLTEILVNMKDRFQGRNYFLNFYGRRVLRIFPLYYSYLLLVALVTMPFFLPDEKSGIDRVDRFYSQLPWALTYTYNIFHATEFYKHTQLIVHFWSLAVEEQFYLLWPLAIYFIPKRHIKIFLLAVIVVTPFIRYVIGQLVINKAIPGIGKDVDLVVYVLPFSHFDAFAIGGFFALYRKGGTAWSIWLFLALIIVLGCFSSWLATGDPHYFAFGYRGFMKNAYQYVWAYTLLNIFFAHLLVTLRDGEFLPTVFNNRFLHYVGEISYGMYVFHYPAIWLVSIFAASWNGYLNIFVAFVITFVAGAISYELMEKRFIDLKYKFFPR